MIKGGDPHGKFIILSFSDGEDAIFANTVTALASVADFSTVAASADAPLLFGSLQIDPQRRLVWQAGQTVDLTPMEFDILLLLARRPGQVFSARQIYEAVAVDSFDSSWTGISSMIYKLRRKLGASIIEMVRDHGYRFTPDSQNSAAPALPGRRCCYIAKDLVLNFYMELAGDFFHCHSIFQCQLYDLLDLLLFRLARLAGRLGSQDLLLLSLQRFDAGPCCGDLRIILCHNRLLF